MRVAREAAGLSLRQLSSLLGCSHSYVTDVEHERKGITVEFAVRLAEVLQLPASELLARAGRLPPETWDYLARTPAMLTLLEEARELGIGAAEIETLRAEMRRRRQIDGWLSDEGDGG